MLLKKTCYLESQNLFTISIFFMENFKHFWQNEFFSQKVSEILRISELFGGKLLFVFHLQWNSSPYVRQQVG